MRALTLLITLLTFNAVVFGQLDAGQDTTICKGEVIQLNATGGSNYQWTSIPPDPSISNPIIANPTIQPDTTTIYIVESREVGPNRLLNGSFQLGNTDFTSDYTYNPTSIWNEGTYAVVDDAGDVHPNFFCSSDHTTGSGLMMCVNGAGVPNVVVWSTTLSNLDPNTEYEFSTWVSSLSPLSPAVLQFRINGQLLGDPFNASIFPCQWKQFFEVWYLGNQNSATISIVNQNTASDGNDFSLDDISFSNVYYLTDTVVVHVVDPPTSSFTMPDEMCSNDTVTIMYTGTGADTATYNWDFDGGTVLSGDGQGPFEIHWDNPGDKSISLWVEYVCDSDTTFKTISINQNPSSDITADATSIPFGTFTYLHGEMQGNPGPLLFNWQPETKLVDASILDPQTKNLENSTTYYFAVIDESSNCESTDSILIEVTGGALGILSLTAVNDTICEGDSTIITVEVTGGSGNYISNWTSEPPGFTYSGPELSLTVKPEETTIYKASIDDGFNTTPESQTEIVVHALTKILQEPADQTATPGISVTFSVDAQNVLNYQWELSKDNGSAWENIDDETNFSGFDSETLTIITTTEEMNGWLFRCLLSGNCAPVESKDALLSVNTAPAITNGLSNQEACANNEFYVSYSVSNFLEIIEMELVLEYDNQQISFIALSDISADLIQNIEVNNQDGELTIKWSNVEPVTIDDGLAFKIGFNGINSGITYLRWKEENCQITNVLNYSPALQFIDSEVDIKPLAVAPIAAYAEPDSLGILDESEIKLWVDGGEGDKVIWTIEQCDHENTMEGSPLFIEKPEQTTTYFAKWENGCGFSSCQKVTVIVDGEFNIYAPSAFSPNGDGVNDEFRLVSPTDLPSFNLMVFNRWGQQVFESDDVFRGWDGQLNGKQSPSGTYVWKAVYKLRREGPGREEQVQTGTVVLIK